MKPLISVVVPVYNEEKSIKKCLDFLMLQNYPKKYFEIILVDNNCKDKTVEIAKGFPITIVPFNGATGIINARLEGLNNVSGDIILCIDGDSFAKNNWIEIMTATLENNKNVLVGSWVKFKGTILGELYNMYSRHLRVSGKRKTAFWIWGASLAFWGKDKKFVQETIKNSVALSNKINLPSSLEDYWLAMLMSRRGNIEVTNKTYVTTSTKDVSSLEMIFREMTDRKSKRLINDYFEKIKEY